MKRIALMILVALAVIGCAKAVNEPTVKYVNRYFDHTGKYFTMEFYR